MLCNLPVSCSDYHLHHSLFSVGVSDPYLNYYHISLQGMIAGHVYYFLEDVYPRMTGRRPLKTPSFIKALFADDNVVVAQAPNAGVGAGARFGGMGPDPQVQ